MFIFFNKRFEEPYLLILFQVIDDESDYFSLEANQWLTPQQRTALQKRSEEINQRRHGSRLDKKFTFDFAGLFTRRFEFSRTKSY
jgi:hypothetical protein